MQKLMLVLDESEEKSVSEAVAPFAVTVVPPPPAGGLQGWLGSQTIIFTQTCGPPSIRMVPPPSFLRAQYTVYVPGVVGADKGTERLTSLPGGTSCGRLICAGLPRVSF